MAIFNSYVKLPEGNHPIPQWFPPSLGPSACRRCAAPLLLRRAGAWRRLAVGAPLGAVAPGRGAAESEHGGDGEERRDAAGKMAPLSKWVKNQQLDSWNIPTHI